MSVPVQICYCTPSIDSPTFLFREGWGIVSLTVSVSMQNSCRASFIDSRHTYSANDGLTLPTYQYTRLHPSIHPSRALRLHQQGYNLQRAVVLCGHQLLHRRHVPRPAARIMPPPLERKGANRCAGMRGQGLARDATEALRSSGQSQPAPKITLAFQCSL